jgi:hypothetical protein
MRTLLLATIASLSLFACKKDKDSGFAYKGHWEGTYTGFDNGTWKADITEDGKFQGTAASNLAPTFPFNVTGTVSNNGAITATYSNPILTANFNGQITGNSASGTWASDTGSIGGAWSGGRK